MLHNNSIAVQYWCTVCQSWYVRIVPNKTNSYYCKACAQGAQPQHGNAVCTYVVVVVVIAYSMYDVCGNINKRLHTYIALLLQYYYKK